VAHSVREARDDSLRDRTRPFVERPHCAAFFLERRTPGINHKRVLRMMREDNLLCVRRKSGSVSRLCMQNAAGTLVGLHPFRLRNLLPTAGADRLCLDQEIRQRFARGRACLRERFDSPTSKPPMQLPTHFPFRTDPSLVRLPQRLASA
jgi:hypothetical protein